LFLTTRETVGTAGITLRADLMGSDTPARMEFKPGDTYSVSLIGDHAAELRGN
jgi:hypothetical protein